MKTDEAWRELEKFAEREINTGNLQNLSAIAAGYDAVGEGLMMANEALTAIRFFSRADYYRGFLGTVGREGVRIHG